MFNKKIAAITGAGSGIGRALAIALAKRGAILALCDINETALNETVALLPASTTVKAYVVNVSIKNEVYEFADKVEQDFGLAHFIFNNAGTAIFGTVANIEIDEMQHVIDINMWGVIYGTKAFLAKMQQQNEGCIVNISSVFGLAASPCQAAYNISKFAVRGLTETLWSELEGSGIRAVVVHPGGIATGVKDNSSICSKGGLFEQKVSRAAAEALVTPPDECAEQILKGLRSGENRLLVGSGAKTLHWITRLFPNHYLNFIGKKLGL